VRAVDISERVWARKEDGVWRCVIEAGLT
jgi:hypothetical protein